MRNEKFKSVVTCIISALIGAGAVICFLYYSPDVFQKVITETVETKNVSITDQGIAEAVNKIYDAVVVVKTYKGKELYSTGTGFVYEIDGNTAYLLTNNHVIESGDEVYVQFTDGRNEKVNVVGSDKYADIAVLSLEANDSVKVASLGSSEEARVGDTVFAVGAPLDASTYSGTVTRGIISGKNRLVSVSISSKTSDWVMSVLQTDAAINSGNSGGPLSNGNGEVIGITSLKLVNDGIEGMGFAIPIETAMEYALKIVKGEEIQRPYLGVQMANLSDAKYALYPRLEDIPLSQGVYVSKVENDSPAAKSGIQIGDIITKMDGQEVSSLAYLRYLLYQHDIGDEIKISVYRNGKEQELTIQLTVANKD